jgi:hypothetical protein
MANPEQLKLIQAVIARLAANSLVPKGWAVTIVAGLAAVAKADGNDDVAWISCGVVVLFALLDAYYLALERAYRKLYESKAAAGEEDDWSLALEHPVTFADVLSALLRFPIFHFYVAIFACGLAVALDVV